MDIDDGFLTLLTPDGEFLRARKQHNHYQIGQEVDFFTVAAIDRKKPLLMKLFASFKGRAVAAAALAMLFSLIMFFPFYQNGQVYAYMSIDINPSLEFGVNENLQVIELTSYNKEGQTIIEEIDDWKKEDFVIVTEKILAKIKEKGYINENKDMIISTVYTGKREKSSDREILKELNKIESDMQKQDLKVKIVEGTAEEREKAIKQGVTTGTYKKQQEIIFETSLIEKKESSKFHKKKVNAANERKKPLEAKQNNNFVDSKKNAPLGLLKKDNEHKRELKEKNQELQIKENSPKKQDNNQVIKHEEQHKKRNNNEGYIGKKLKEKDEKHNLLEKKIKNEQKKINFADENQKTDKEKHKTIEVKNKFNEKKHKTNEEKYRARKIKNAGEEKNNTVKKNRIKRGVYYKKVDHHKEKSGDM